MVYHSSRLDLASSSIIVMPPEPWTNAQSGNPISNMIEEEVSTRELAQVRTPQLTSRMKNKPIASKPGSACHFIRVPAGMISVQVPGHNDVTHQSLYECLAMLYALLMCRRIIRASRVWNDCRQKGRLVRSEGCCGTIEIVPRGRFGAINAVSPFNHV